MEFNEARVLFYCLGAGMGHLTRAAAILRKLRRLISGDIAIITNSPFHYLLEIEDLNTIYLKNLTEIDDHTGSLIRDIIEQINPELLVVDTHPAGIRKELVPLLEGQKFKRALLRRYIDETIISHADMARLTRDCYDLVLDFEPLAPLEHNNEIDCHPLLIRDEEELREPEVARDVLMAKNSEKVVLALSTDQKQKSLDFFTLIEKAFSTIRHENFVLRFASPFNLTDIREDWHTIRYFPLFELFRGVDLLVAGNENTNVFYECSAAGLPAIFVGPVEGKPLRDPSDLRYQSEPTIEDLERKLREAMERALLRTTEPPSFENKAQKAAAYLSHVIFSQDAEKLREYRERLEWFLK
jgi:hypothetical protein